MLKKINSSEMAQKNLKTYLAGKNWTPILKMNALFELMWANI